MNGIPNVVQLPKSLKRLLYHNKLSFYLALTPPSNFTATPQLTHCPLLDISSHATFTLKTFRGTRETLIYTRKIHTCHATLINHFLNEPKQRSLGQFLIEIRTTKPPNRTAPAFYSIPVGDR